MGEKNYKILIIDDHPIFREGLKSILQRDHRIYLCAEVPSGIEGIEETKECKPDLILLDISLPDTSGLQLIKDLLKASPKSKILIVTMHTNIEFISQAFEFGANGYILKDSAAVKLLDGIYEVLHGGTYVDSLLTADLITKMKDKDNKTSSYQEKLTSREKEITTLLVEGFSTKDIADRLYISRKTVENHRASIMKKLNVKNVIDLVRTAARYGIINFDSWKN